MTQHTEQAHFHEPTPPAAPHYFYKVSIGGCLGPPGSGDNDYDEPRIAHGAKVDLLVRKFLSAGWVPSVKVIVAPEDCDGRMFEAKR